MLLSFSSTVDKDIKKLLQKGLLQKLSRGLYHKPVKSQFGVLPPDNKNLISCYLQDKNFLLYSWNKYNSLGLGLTQLYNRMIVLNRKRQGSSKLGNKSFYFLRTNKQFPKKVSREFLLIDLINHLSELAEDSSEIKARTKKTLVKFDRAKLRRLVKDWGDKNTKDFFDKILNSY